MWDGLNPGLSSEQMKFEGIARVFDGEDGAMEAILTGSIKPGTVLWQDGRPQAPHISLLVFARGINIHLHTRLYFEDETAANAADPVLNIVDAHLRPTLIAKKSKRGSETVYKLDIVLQGDNETVFFDM